MNVLRRLSWSALAFVSVVVVGTVGYWMLGFGLLDAAYQTITTITTVGFREVEPLGAAGQVFTMLLILAGVGTALYLFGVAFESLVEGDLRAVRRRRRMDREIAGLRDHVVVCGWGRVGNATARYVHGEGHRVVVVDHDPERLAGIEHLHVAGDATDDAVLMAAGIMRAKALIAAIDTDAENLYVTLSGRSLRPDLFIIARARDEASEAKLRRAGADRVVNPQAIGGARMGAFVSQPFVSEFLDVVMHEAQVEFRLEEVPITASSALAGAKIRDAAVRERTGALGAGSAQRRRGVRVEPAAGPGAAPGPYADRDRHAGRTGRPRRRRRWCGCWPARERFCERDELSTAQDGSDADVARVVVAGDATHPSQHLRRVHLGAVSEHRVDVDPVLRSVEHRLADDEVLWTEDGDRSVGEGHDPARGPAAWWNAS